MSTERGWLAKQVKQSERNIQLKDVSRTMRLERELEAATDKLAKVRKLIKHYRNTNQSSVTGVLAGIEWELDK